MRWLLVAGLLASTAAAEPIPPKYDVAAFGRLPMIEDAEISPDGTAIAAKLVVDGQQQFAVIPLAAGTKAAITGLGSISLGRFRWVNNDRVIASILSTDNIEGRLIRVSRLLSLGRTASAPLKLDWQPGAQDGSDVIWVPRDGSASILLATRTTVYTNFDGYWPRVDLVNATTGKVKTIQNAREGIQDWYADHRGNIRMGFGYSKDTNRGYLVYRPTTDVPFKVIDRAAYSKDQDLIEPVLFLDEPNKLIVESDHEGRSGYYKYDFVDGKFAETIFSRPKYDIGQAILSADGSTIAGVRWVDDRVRTEWFDADLKQLQLDLDKSVPGRFAHIASMDAERNRMLVEVSSPTSPPAWWVMDRDTGKMSKFGSSNDSLKGAVLAPMKPVSYKARDGLDIPAYLTLPVGREAKNLPLVVMPHGGPAARDHLGYDYWVQFLANRGYAVLQPNYRGSTGYGSDFQDKGDGQWGLAMQDDVTDGVKWAVAQGLVDAKRVCIVGGSYGGYTALQGAVRDPDLYRCAVSFAGVSDMAVQSRYDDKFLYRKIAKRERKRAAPDFAAISPANFAAGIKIPVLLIHGKKDLSVPYDQSVRMNAAMIKAKKYVEFVTQPEGDHHLSRQVDRIEFLTRLETFLTKWNPAN